MTLAVRRPDRKQLWALSVLLLFCYYMVWPVNFYLALTLKSTYYMLLVPVLVGGVLYFYGRSEDLAYRLLIAYWLWFFLTRVLNGSFALQDDYQITVDLGLMLPFFALGRALGPARRRRFLGWLSALTGGYYFLVGLLCLFAFVQRRIYVNPITEGSIGLSDQVGFVRLNVFDTNPNASAYWFMMAFFLMVYAFFACRKKRWRVPITLAALVDFLVIAVTYSRSVELAVALAMGVLAALLLRRALKRLPRIARAALLLPALLLTALALYSAAGLCADGLSSLSYSLYPASSPAYTAAPTAAQGRYTAVTLGTKGESTVRGAADPETGNEDTRGWTGDLDSLSSGRITIWRSAFQALGVKPSVLWKGQLLKDTMTISNTFVDTAVTFALPVHYHNALIQVLMTTGLFGLGLILVLLWLILRRCARLCFFSDAALADQVLALPVLAALVYYMLEAGAFTDCDVRTLYFYLMCGMVCSF